MAQRHPFGGSVADWVMKENSESVPVLQSGATLTFYNARSGGTQYTDLALDSAGTTAVTFVTSSTGSDGYRIGQVPIFFGPPDITFMWMSADGGERVLIGAVDSADLAGAIAAQFAAHISNPNAHGTTFSALVDVDFPDLIPPGSVPVWNSTAQAWEASSATGLNPDAFVKTVGGSTVRIADGNTTTTALTIRIPAGDRAAAVNTLQTYWNSGTDAVPVWIPVTELNEYGELRVQASANNRVAARIKRRSSGHTADLTQWTTEGNVPLAWVAANGSLRGPNVFNSIPFTKTGALTVGDGKFVWTNLSGVPLVAKAFFAYVDVAPTGAPIIFDVRLNGVTMFTTPTRPQIAAGSQVTGASPTTNFTVTTIPPMGRVTVDIKGIGSTVAGSDLSAQLDVY
jgi:hypothetical protein